MKHLFLLIFLTQTITAVDMKVAAETTKAIPLKIWYQDKKDLLLQKIAADIQRCFSFTKQFSVSIEQTQKLPTKKQLKVLKDNQKILLLVVISAEKDGYEWRLYDTMSGTQISVHRYLKQGEVERAWAYAIADQMWPVLTNQEGFFSTKIAYCKKVPKKQVKHIYISDFDGSYAQCLVDTPTINIAPRWNHDRRQPLLFYSDYTPTNVRLKVVGLNKKSQIASDFDGLNMIPAFCEDGSKLVYCLSRGDGYCQIYYHDKKSFKNITHNHGNNVSPSLSADGNIIFYCSDFETKSPQLYAYNLEKDSVERLTTGGYCASPRYCPKAHKVAYAKMVKGVMQLFTYDVASKSHEQLTFDEANKQECAWSPCGNWLIYGVGPQGKSSQIALMNRHSKIEQYITNPGSDCCYPDWSPRYAQFPIACSA